MNIKEQHLYIEQNINKIGAKLFDFYQPEEIDLMINKQIERFIKQRFLPDSNPRGKGFEQDSKRIADLRNLVVKYYADKAYEPLTETLEREKVARFVFPGDYFLPTSIRANIVYDECKNPSELYFHRVSSSVYYFKVPVPRLLPDMNLATFQLEYNAVSLLVSPYNELTVGYFNYPTDRSNFIKWVMDNVNSQGGDFTVYFERYKTIYVPNNFILVYNPGTAPASTVEYTYSGPVTVSYSTESLRRVTSGLDAPQPGGLYPLKFVTSEALQVIERDSFSSTRPWAPLCEMHSSYMDIYFDETFCVEDVIISYIRKPAVVSYNLGIDCDLDPMVHAEICDLVVLDILENSSQQRYNTNSNELLKTE